MRSYCLLQAATVVHSSHGRYYWSEESSGGLRSTRIAVVAAGRPPDRAGPPADVASTAFSVWGTTGRRQRVCNIDWSWDEVR